MTKNKSRKELNKVKIIHRIEKSIGHLEDRRTSVNAEEQYVINHTLEFLQKLED